MMRLIRKVEGLMPARRWVASGLNWERGVCANTTFATSFSMFRAAQRHLSRLPIHLGIGLNEKPRV
jgi:hypothetical protein